MPNQEKPIVNPAEITLFPFQLIDVRIFEIRAERCDPEDEDREVVPFSVELLSPEDSDTSSEFGILLEFTAGFPLEESPVCEIHLSIEGLFTPIVDSENLKPEVIEQFITNDALVLFWPYLRHYLHDLSTKMRLGIPPIPIIDPRSLINPKNAAESVEPSDM